MVARGMGWGDGEKVKTNKKYKPLRITKKVTGI